MTNVSGMTLAGRVQSIPVEVHHPGLAGTTAVVTGAARGMGAAFALGLCRHSVNVIAADLDWDGVDGFQVAESDTPTSRPLGKLVTVTADVTDASQHSHLVEVALNEFGRLDSWVNNAGIFPESPALDISQAQMAATFGVNVNGVLFGAQAAGRYMKDHGGGVIVNMASVAAVRVRPSRGAYAASKAAVDHLTRVLAVEFGKYGVRVNAIAPGFIHTEMTRWVHQTPGALEHVLGTVPLGRIGSTEEVLGALLFLLSDSSRYVTGHTLAVDGGSRHV